MTELRLREFQIEHDEWRRRNFGDQLPHHALLGLAEEVGELAHAHLKHEQGIRAIDDDAFMAEAADAVGDILIYLSSYCSTNGLDLEDCVRVAWREVSERDWVAYPDTGRPPKSAEKLRYRVGTSNAERDLFVRNLMRVTVEALDGSWTGESVQPDGLSLADVDDVVKRMIDEHETGHRFADPPTDAKKFAGFVNVTGLEEKFNDEHADPCDTCGAKPGEEHTGEGHFYTSSVQSFKLPEANLMDDAARARVMAAELASETPLADGLIDQVLSGHVVHAFDSASGAKSERMPSGVILWTCACGEATYNERSGF